MRKFHLFFVISESLQKEYGGTRLKHLEVHLDLYLEVKRLAKT